MIYKNKILEIFFLVLFSKFIIIYLKKNYIYFFCKKCAYKNHINHECNKCTTEILFKSIKVKSREETLKELMTNKKSISRFGDGEFGIIFGKSLRFQKFNETLKNKLLTVLNSNIPNLLIGIIPLIFNNPFWINWMQMNKFKVRKILNENKFITVLILQDSISLK